MSGEPPSGEPPVWGGGAVDGPGWSALMAWTGLVLGAVALLFAFAAPLGSQPSGIVWVAVFGAIAVWFGLFGNRQLRNAEGGHRLSAIVGLIGALLGILTLAVMAYAWLALMLGGWPVPSAWELPVEAPALPGTST
ncbi:hypothetical protein [Agromyces aerolatus]|uniref:hypothetical protein n=1 Tax=Agromyces sp. LY-1074 TaxID=3074080 RepID=UPI00286783AE|nr:MULTISPECIES: hypothetical protein [unclassified Agromyces]MDR5698570.1 hypothetical protein [Agromyces sp. LY-1074]MDR5704864.1 hypothetical protein [Agromyces sp. LY-1358]